jgi:adenylate kinase family enzyme
MRRVLVIGSGGAGKTRFARRLGEITGLPVVHLDSLYWSPGWVEPDKDAWKRQVQRLIGRERWILDGNYGGTLDLRLAACDTVIFLDLPRVVCLWRVVRRSMAHGGRARADLPDGCPERLSAEFLWWVWSYPGRRRSKILARLRSLRPDQRAVVLTSTASVERYLGELSTRHGDRAERSAAG